MGRIYTPADARVARKKNSETPPKWEAKTFNVFGKVKIRNIVQKNVRRWKIVSNMGELE